MCGINLIVTGNHQDYSQHLERMMEATAFRGPDASDSLHKPWAQGSLYLGANRLRIVDDNSDADQPLISSCGRYALAYNGEVYNYHDLKTELIELGQQFRTHSDTEVVLYWLKHHGADGLMTLKGMFSLVFVDFNDQTILVARDPFGIKPLYYYHNSNTLLVSSSLPAILASDLGQKELNRQAIQEYLDYRYIMGSKTVISHIQSVEPGNYLTYKQGQLEKSQIPQVQETNQGNKLNSALIDAVTLTTSTNRSPALLLSGGVDSTLLLAIMRQELGIQRIPTFTLPTSDDASWARKAAKLFDAEHIEVALDIEDLPGAMQLLDHMDQPIADHGLLATGLIAKRLAINHNVLLSGAGADELFGGYNRHMALNSYRRHRKAWLIYKQFAGKINYWGHGSRLKYFLKSIDVRSRETFDNFLKIHGLRNFSQLIDKTPLTTNPEIDLQEALAFDFNNYLVNDVLRITDIATLAHGVEARVPYLYNDVVASAQKIPASEKIRRKGKAPLKAMLSAYGGQQFAQRSKIGFGLPMADWLRSSRTDYLWEFLVADDPVYEFVRKKTIKNLLAEHRSGKHDWNMQLWSILVLSKWLKRNLR